MMDSEAQRILLSLIQHQAPSSTEGKVNLIAFYLFQRTCRACSMQCILARVDLSPLFFIISEKHRGYDSFIRLFMQLPAAAVISS